MKRIDLTLDSQKKSSDFIKRILILTALASIICCNVNAQYNAKITPEIELISIIGTLSNINNNSCQLTQYKEDVTTYFRKYQNHKCCKLVHEYNTENKISYNDLLFIALYLNNVNGKLELSNIDLILNKLDKLSKSELEEFVKLMNDFYYSSKFNNFFDNHKSLYSECEQAYLNRVNGQVNYDILNRIFNNKLQKPNIILSILNGDQNVIFSSINTIIISNFTTETSNTTQSISLSGGMYKAYSTIMGIIEMNTSHYLLKSTLERDNATNKIYDFCKAHLNNYQLNKEDIYSDYICNTIFLYYLSEVKKSTKQKEIIDNYTLYFKFYSNIYNSMGYFWINDNFEYLTNKIDNREFNIKEVIYILTEKYIETGKTIELINSRMDK